MRFNHEGVISEITSLPGSSQICIFHDVFVPEKYRHQGKGLVAHLLRIEEAKKLGYQMAICTVAENNIFQIKILEHNQWQRGNTFWSQKTGHKVILFTKVLDNV